MMLAWCEVRDRTNQGQNTIATKNGFDGTIVIDSRPNGRSYQLSQLEFFFALTVASPSTTFGFSISFERKGNIETVTALFVN